MDKPILSKVEENKRQLMTSRTEWLQVSGVRKKACNSEHISCECVHVRALHTDLAPGEKCGLMLALNCAPPFQEGRILKYVQSNSQFFTSTTQTAGQQEIILFLYSHPLK